MSCVFRASTNILAGEGAPSKGPLKMKDVAGAPVLKLSLSVCVCIPVSPCL